jgi:hypothetical protein
LGRRKLNIQKKKKKKIKREVGRAKITLLLQQILEMEGKERAEVKEEFIKRGRLKFKDGEDVK